MASVSCIYGLGSPEAYYGMLVNLHVGMELDRNTFLHNLVEVQYERNDIDFHRGTFRVRGDCVEVFPAYEEKRALRIEFSVMRLTPSVKLILSAVRLSIALTGLRSFQPVITLQPNRP